MNAVFLMWPYMHTGLNSTYFSHFAVGQEKCGPGLGLGSPGSLWNAAWTVEMSEEPRSVFSLLASCFPLSRALSEKIVSVLPRMKCPHQLEPHQIQGMDFIHIFPVVQVSASEGFLVLWASAYSCDGSGSRAWILDLMVVAWIWRPQNMSALPSVILGMLSVFTCLHSTQSPVLIFECFLEVAFRCPSGRPPCSGSLQSLQPQFILCFSLFSMFQPLWLSFQSPPTYCFPVTGPFSQLSVPGLLKKAPSSFAIFSYPAYSLPSLGSSLPHL